MGVRETDWGSTATAASEPMTKETRTAAPRIFLTDTLTLRASRGLSAAAVS